MGSCPAQCTLHSFKSKRHSRINQRKYTSLRSGRDLSQFASPRCAGPRQNVPWFSFFGAVFSESNTGAQPQQARPAESPIANESLRSHHGNEPALFRQNPPTHLLRFFTADQIRYTVHGP